MAAIFDFNGRGRLGREWNLYQGGGRRSRIRRGLGEWKLRLPEVIVVLRNSVPRRKEFLIGAVKLQLSITSQICHLDILLLRGNAKDGKLCKWWSCYFQIPLSKRHLIKCLSEFNMPRALKLWQKEAISSLVSGKDLLAVLPKEPDIWGVGLYERHCDGKTFERSCHLSASTFCLWSNGISIFDRINGSCAHGLSFGGYRVRQILTRICVSRERFVKPFFSLMKKKGSHSVSPEFAGLHETNYGG